MIKKTQLLYFLINAFGCVVFLSLAIQFKLLPFFANDRYAIWLFTLTLLYLFSGNFLETKRKSRFKELVSTANQSLLLGIFLLACIPIFQSPHSPSQIFKVFRLCLLHFGVLTIFRLLFLTAIKKLLQNRKIGFNTLIIGNNLNAKNIVNEINQQKKSLGFKIVGFYDVDTDSTSEFQLDLPNFSAKKSLQLVLKESEIEEVIIAVETSQHQLLKKILNELENHRITVHIIPDVYDIVSGFVKISYLFAIPLITLHPHLMPLWQRIVKTIIDYCLSVCILLILSPIYLLIALFIKLDSKGAVLYSQERIGKNGKPFKIHKFRTMHSDAEQHGPMLSSYNDQRITGFGIVLRRLRLDELPQFFNVLKGEMSIVGPRPERQFYINQIVDVAPHYHQLQKVLPGITSWGQVKFGYAENLEQMINRLTFDIIYVQNRSLALDFKIMAYTIAIIIQGRGK